MLLLTMINLHTKFNMSSFTHYKDMMQVPTQKLKNGSLPPSGKSQGHVTRFEILILTMPTWR